jgi:hypothetical protein
MNGGTCAQENTIVYKPEVCFNGMIQFICFFGYWLPKKTEAIEIEKHIYNPQTKKRMAKPLKPGQRY